MYPERLRSAESRLLLHISAREDTLYSPPGFARPPPSCATSQSPIVSGGAWHIVEVERVPGQHGRGGDWRGD